jgi:hypothetical protein
MGAEAPVKFPITEWQSVSKKAIEIAIGVYSAREAASKGAEL